MPQNGRYEQQFLDALKAIFIGAKVEGESGYINLMKIKATYFEQGVFPRLMQDIDATCKPFEKSFREELFDKLYDFFRRYFSESGSIYFRHTAASEGIYERVYTDDRDVMLFWKTHMLYYVKTDRLFNSMEVAVDDERFFFDVSGMKLKRANEKRELIYEFKRRDKDGRLVFAMTYSEKGRKTKVEEILAAVRKTGVTVDEETLERAFRIFEKQSEVDYFINKDARAFLEEQFDLWFYQYIFRGESTFTETRLRQLQAIKVIAYEIIGFIARFEDELVAVWNKPKFVLNSHYVITLDKILNRDADLVDRIFAHAGMAAQFTEWCDLGMLENDPASPAALLDLLRATDLTGSPLHPRYRFLPLDTKHFPDLELVILALFDDLDAALDGWLVHSENYQALNTLLPKFRGQVKCIYIDPPYNTAASEIIYSNTYKHSSWLTLMENRLRLSRPLLNNDGVEIVAIDDTEMTVLSELLDVLLPDYDRSVVVVNHHPAGAGLEGTNISTTHEYALFMTPTGKKVLYGERKGDVAGKIGFIRTGTAESNLRIGRPNSFYAVLVDPQTSTVVGAEPPPNGPDWPRERTPQGLVRIYPVSADGTERVWRRSYESCLKEIEKGNIQCQSNKILYLLTDESEKHRPIYSNWTDTRYNAGAHGTNLLTDIIGSPVFSYPKSINTVTDCVNAATVQTPGALVVDFFAGSGTTAHAVMNLNRADGGSRKYILVEMGEHFHTVILPRVKKIAFSDKWKNGRANDGQGMSHFVKYYDLEQYEDTLRRANYGNHDAPLFAATPDELARYVFLRDLKLLDAVTIDAPGNQVAVVLDRLYPGIDLAETLSCLTGKWIKRITADTVEFADSTTADLATPRWEAIKSLVWW